MKTFNLGNYKGLELAQKRFSDLVNAKAIIELDRVNKTRTNQQNKALHLFFTILSEQLNEIGFEFQFQEISGKTIEIMYTPQLVKDFIWHPIQMALFNIQSTAKINTEQINKILDVLTKHFADMYIEVKFPNEFDKYLKIYE